MPRRKRVPTIAESLQAITRQLAALTERVREAEAVKNAVDQVMRSGNTTGVTLTATGKRRGRPPGSKNKPKPANGRRRRTTATSTSATGRRRRGRPRKSAAPAAAS